MVYALNSIVKVQSFFLVHFIIFTKSGGKKHYFRCYGRLMSSLGGYSLTFSDEL